MSSDFINSVSEKAKRAQASRLESTPVDIGVAPASLVKEYLKDGAVEDLSVDGSITPQDFIYTVPAGKILSFFRLILYMEAGTAFSAELFANQAALANGIAVSVGGVVIETWKDNIDLVTTFYDAEGRVVFSKADRSLSGRWTFNKDSGGALTVAAGDTIKMTIADNLSALVHFKVKVSGYLSDV